MPTQPHELLRRSELIVELLCHAIRKAAEVILTNADNQKCTGKNVVDLAGFVSKCAVKRQAA